MIDDSGNYGKEGGTGTWLSRYGLTAELHGYVDRFGVSESIETSLVDLTNLPQAIHLIPLPNEYFSETIRI